MTAGLKSLAIWAGRALLVAALVFVGFKLHAHWNALAGWRPSGTDTALLLGLAGCYGLALFLLAEGWHRIVNLFADQSRARSYPSFTMTQVAKYLPGNIAHLVGKGLILRGGTLSDGQIVKATLIELAVIPSGALICIVLLGTSGQLGQLLPSVPLIAWWILALVCLCLLAAARPLAGNRLAGIKNAWPGLLSSIGLAAVFMSLLGGTFAAIFHLLAAAPVAPLAGSAILAWLIGFLTPGAPGGIGTREAALIAFLGALGQPDSALIATLLFRLVTTLGDVVLFCTGWVLVRKKPAADLA